MRVLTALLSLLAPHDCLHCGAEGSLLCLACRAGLEPAVSRCYKCHAATRGFLTCAGCRTGSSISSVHAAVKYESLSKELIWKLKFARARGAAAEAAAIMTVNLRLSERLAAWRDTTIVVTHAPTANSRVRERGYDQAALIARALSRSCHITYTPLLVRRGRAKQVGATRSLRKVQLVTAFRPVSRRRIRGAHIILVDDVVTTGATLEAAAKALVDAGARRVDAIVFAQA